MDSPRVGLEINSNLNPKIKNFEIQTKVQLNGLAASWTRISSVFDDFCDPIKIVSPYANEVS